MKLTKFFLLFVLAVVTFGMSSCSDDETYADQLDRERDHGVGVLQERLCY